MTTLLRLKSIYFCVICKINKINLFVLLDSDRIYLCKSIIMMIFSLIKSVNRTKFRRDHENHSMKNYYGNKDCCSMFFLYLVFMPQFEWPNCRRKEFSWLFFIPSVILNCQIELELVSIPLGPIFLISEKMLSCLFEVISKFFNKVSLIIENLHSILYQIFAWSKTKIFGFFLVWY
jgi:hypothetical protein